MTAPKLPSKRTASFKKLYLSLPEKAQKEADEAYRRFKADPDYPGLGFKHITGQYYSVRISGSYRALAMLRAGYWLWFWIGTHTEYDKILDGLRQGRQGV
jgi:hypothetical protein